MPLLTLGGLVAWLDPGEEQRPDPYMLISAERLASLPTSGDAYEYMQQRADEALAEMDLEGTPSSFSPWLANFEGAGQLTRPATQVLAAALVYARIGDERYREFVIAANRYALGSEDSPSTDGTSESDRTLAVSRSIAAYVMAADLVDMDPSLTGTRPGYTDTNWSTWLNGLRTKPTGVEGAQCNTIVQCSDERGHNWGAFATTGRIAIDIYLGDQDDLAAAVSRLRRFLGDTSQGGQWLASEAFDPTYACTPSGSQWVAINPADCGPGKDGMIVEDISRSSGPFPSYDETGIGYTMESYQALLLSAVLLERQGYAVFEWSDQALRRVMDWLEREGYPQGNGSSVEQHQSWIANHFYDEDYSTAPAMMGRSLGFTDWLYG